MVFLIARPQTRRPSVKDRIHHNVLDNLLSFPKIPIPLPSKSIAKSSRNGGVE